MKKTTIILTIILVLSLVGFGTDFINCMNNGLPFNFVPATAVFSSLAIAFSNVFSKSKKEKESK